MLHAYKPRWPSPSEHHLPHHGTGRPSSPLPPGLRSADRTALRWPGNVDSCASPACWSWGWFVLFGRPPPPMGDVAENGLACGSDGYVLDSDRLTSSGAVLLQTLHLRDVGKDK